MQDAGCKMQDEGCRIQDARCGMQDAGCKMRDAGSRGGRVKGSRPVIVLVIVRVIDLQAPRHRGRFCKKLRFLSFRVEELRSCSGAEAQKCFGVTLS
jgi:hypothetical protein